MSTQKPNIAGTTYDGLTVGSPYRLRFLPVCFGSFALSWDRILGFDLQFNRNAKGRKRPYYLAWVLGLHITGGWLFDDRS